MYFQFPQLSFFFRQGRPKGALRREGYVMIVVNSYIPVSERASQLGCLVPQGLAVIPRNFTSAERREDLFYETSVSILRDLMKLGGVPESLFEPDGEKFPLRDAPPEESASITDVFPWQWPSLYAHAAFLAQNESLVAGALDAVSDFLVHWFKRSPEQERSVKMALVIEKADGTCRQIQYDGPASSLGALMTIVREVGR